MNDASQYPSLSSPQSAPSTSSQLEICLPPRPTNEILADRLAAYVDEFNEALTTPERRVELHAQIVRLRATLQKGAQ